jgi:hypothetical protein
MSYKFSFADNVKYSAADVNNITKRLVTSGIEDSFENGVAYNISRFNEAGQLLYTSGVVPESCLTLKVVPSSDGKIIINPGCAFFNDGSVIEVTEGGEELSYTKDAFNYVYLKNNLEAANVSYPCCSVEAPEGDYVMLATIEENGVISDKRTYAHGKLPGYQSVTEGLMFMDEKVELILSERSVASGEFSFDIGGNKFKYIIAIGKIGDSTQRETVSIYRIEDGKITSLVRKGSTEAVYTDAKMYLYFDRVHKNICAVPTITDGVLNMKIKAEDSRDGLGEIGDKIYIDVKLIFI